MNAQAVIRCIVTDDEPLAVNLLADYVNKTPGFELILKTTNVLDALDAVQQGRADLVFLDIQMPELTGIQFMKIIRGACKIIITTAYPEYALQGYEFDVVDYLLKPVTYERFVAATQKAIARLENKSAVVATNTIKHIFVKADYKIRKIDLNDILYIEALRDYTAIHLLNEKLLSLESLRNYESLLPETQFVRIHKSYIINTSKISFIERSKVIINKEYLPVGETYRKHFFSLIGVDK
ncbi:LytTR family DNA-binding domain-containing protein [Danxiaibacter flavus]|uniref:LytTR family DNA-binding domain-containing protein n=1 Tax=Danxiaibacter flavus TaxID=3049108 RepID=A0ABV3ZC60_9BACT|nr:LytTR family DNA-binding domain-containing protein [Chitinophagaceae bacterium DXS]